MRNQLCPVQTAMWTSEIDGDTLVSGTRWWSYISNGNMRATQTNRPRSLILGPGAHTVEGHREDGWRTLCLGG